MKKNIFATTVLLLLSGHLSAALLKGVVKDQQTGEELIGASLYIKEYPSIGATTGLDGSFVLKNVPEGGRITLVCSYISYQTQEVVVNSSSSETILLTLAPTSLELDNVVVIGTADKGSDNQARSMEKNAANVLNIVSAKSIEISPDLNVANVLQRVSGVTMQRDNSGEAQYAILRGMDKRYNYTLVNGVKIPSPDNKNRYVPLNIFPSELMDRLEVTKSLTADMEGDATGGAVNMVMKDAPGHFALQANLAGGYNSTFFDRDYAQFDAGQLLHTAPREQYGDTYKATLADFPQGTTTLSYKRPMPNMTGGLSIGNRFLDNRLGVMLAGSYQNLYKGSSSLFFSDQMNQTESTVRVTSRKDRTYSEQQSQYGVHAKLDFRFNPQHKLEWYNAFIGMQNRQVRETVDTDFSLNYNPDKGNLQQELETRSRYVEQQIFASTLQGEHALNSVLHLDWSGVFSKAKNEMPDRTYVTLTNYQKEFVPHISAESSERRWEHNTDRDVAGYLNLNYQLPLSFARLEMKVGGMYRDKDRSNQYVSYRFLPESGTNPVQGTDFNTLNEIPWKINTPQGGVGPLVYDAHENIGAAYWMGKLERENGHLIVGLRAEHTDQGYFMYYPNSQNDPEGRQTYWDFLPSVHLKYVPVENMNLRASYFRSINRPGFFEIVPYNIINEEYTEYGNPDLKRAKIDNFDLRWEYFPRPTEQLMVGLFYKHIQDPIEEAYTTINGRQFGYGPVNLGNANNYGIELDVIKYIRNWGVKANYTYTYSRITTGKTVYYKDESGDSKAKNVDQSRPMVNQAPHVCNVSLLYKDTRYGWDAQLAAAYTGKKIIIASHYLDSDYWEDGMFTLDLSAEKSFKCGLSLFAKANNLLDTALRRYIPTINEVNGRFEDQDLSSGKTLIREDHYGRTFLIGCRFKM
ncbi:MAG: TonB-dependent receptor domain-containing protein [Parabacteroides sp.]